MSNFKLDEGKLPYICSQLGIVNPSSVALVDDIYVKFLSFYDNFVRTQYLAPIVMALERYIQMVHGKTDFKIVIRTTRSDCNTKRGVAFFRQDKGRYEIAVPHSVDVITARNIVAHELGHLFYVMNYAQGDVAMDMSLKSCLEETMADIVGIFTILERTDFYKRKAFTVNRSNWIDVVTDFKKLGVGRRCRQDHN